MSRGSKRRVSYLANRGVRFYKPRGRGNTLFGNPDTHGRHIDPVHNASAFTDYSYDPIIALWCGSTDTNYS